MKKIGLLSDTHAYLSPQIFNYFQDCDEIWHAGDIGSEQVVDKLEAFKPLRAVYGNIDDANMRRRFPESLVFDCEGVKVFITHIGGYPKRYAKGITDQIKSIKPQLFICGHSHILRVMPDTRFEPFLYMNPGAAGKHGFHQVATLLRFEITNAKIQNLEVIELGKRGSFT
ncbi:MAG: metallophosphoesterase family protein [Bernardetiaceae bacterium]|nr:metallophosphoesterase family protein [Bernardetiaceae bacterium]